MLNLFLKNKKGQRKVNLHLKGKKLMNDEIVKKKKN